MLRTAVFCLEMQAFSAVAGVRLVRQGIPRNGGRLFHVDALAHYPLAPDTEEYAQLRDLVAVSEVLIQSCNQSGLLIDPIERLHHLNAMRARAKRVGFRTAKNVPTHPRIGSLRHLNGGSRGDSDRRGYLAGRVQTWSFAKTGNRYHWKRDASSQGRLFHLVRAAYRLSRTTDTIHRLEASPAAAVPPLAKSC